MSSLQGFLQGMERWKWYMFSYWWSKILSRCINHQSTNGLSLLCDQMVVIIELVPTLQVCICLNGCKLISTCFSIISRTLAGLINNYFGGYYAEKMVEAHVWFCIDRSSLNQWTNTLPITMSLRNGGQGFATITITSNLLHDYSSLQIECEYLSTCGAAGIWIVNAWTFSKIMWVLPFWLKEYLIHICFIHWCNKWSD
jgi:hypothetical protein